MKHRRLMMETLEIRSLLSAVGFESDAFASQNILLGPTAEEQELFELMNGFRTDPQGELDRLFTTIFPPTPIEPNARSAVTYYNDPTSQEILDDWADFQPLAPLSWNDILWTAAVQHNASMIQHDDQTHQTPSEPPMEDRFTAAGYSDWNKIGENVFTEAESVFHAHSAFVIDWDVSDRGHRLNIMDEAFTEAGVAIENEDSPLTSVGPKVVTVEFGGGGLSASIPKIMGVVYDDLNGNARYDAGEGLGGVDITIVGPSGTFATTTLLAGGYQIPVFSGEYEVAASGGALIETLVYDYVFVDRENVKVDFNAANPPKSRPLLDLNGEEGGLDVVLDWREGASPASLAASMTLTDRDSDVLQGAAATVLSWTSSISTGVLSVSTEGTEIDATFDSSTGVLTLEGTDTVENYALVLGSLTFVDQASLPALGVREIEVVADDGDSLSRSAIARVRVLPSIEPIVLSSDLVVSEHDGQYTAFLSLALSESTTRPVSVDYEAYAETGVPGPASAGDDFLAASGSVVFAPGETSASVILTIFGDTIPEADETFGVALSLPSIQGASGLTAPILLASLENPTNIVTLEDDDTPTILGQVAHFVEQDVDVNQRRGLYQFTASSTGPLTVIASFYGGAGLDQDNPDAAIDGDAGAGTIRLYAAPWDGLAPSVADAAAGPNGEVSLQTNVLAGAEYVLEFDSDANVNLDWAFANVVERINEEEVRIVGGTEPEEFVLDLGETPQLMVGGAPVVIDLAWLSGLAFEGNSSNDTLTITGSEAFESWSFDPLDATLRQGGYNISVDGFEVLKIDGVRTAGGAAGDALLLLDSPGDDALNAGQGRVQFQVGDLMFMAENIADLQVEASRGGRDEAFLYDSTANDRLVAGPSTAFLSGGGFEIRTDGFDEMTVFAYSGGEDSALCYDSTADDRLLADPVWGAVLSGEPVAGDPYKLNAVGFRDIEVRSTAGGYDVALFVDSPMQDVVHANSDYVGIQDLAEKRLIGAWAFEYVDVLARNVSDAVSVSVDESQGESLETIAYGPQEYGYFLTAPTSTVSVRRRGELPSGLAVPPEGDASDSALESDASSVIEINSVASNPAPSPSVVFVAEDESITSPATLPSSVSVQLVYEATLASPLDYSEESTPSAAPEATDALFNDVPGLLPSDEPALIAEAVASNAVDLDENLFDIDGDSFETSDLDEPIDEDVFQDPWDWIE